MKIGFIAGAFDLLHPGHIHALGECRKSCDMLLVGLHVNPRLERKEKNLPVQTVFERFVQLHACMYVDDIIPYETETDLLNLLKMQDIDIRFLGTEYQEKGRKITGKSIIPIKYIKRHHSFSSTELRKKL